MEEGEVGMKHWVYAFVRLECSLLLFVFVLFPFTIENLRDQLLRELPFVSCGLSGIVAFIYAIILSAYES